MKKILTVYPNSHKFITESDIDRLFFLQTS